MMWGNYWHYGWPGFIGWWGFLGPGFGILLMAAMIFLCMRHSSSRGMNHNKQESALDILKKRYAKGEISKDEFERIKKDITE